MMRYLKAALLYAPKLPGLGRFPLNAICVLGYAVLGIAHPGFWLLGLGLEAAYLFALSTNKRFQQLVDTQHQKELHGEAFEQRNKLVARLTPGAQRRLSALEAKYQRIKKLYLENNLNEAQFEANRDALQRLLWSYLKLLLARSTLESVASPQDLREQAVTLEKEIASPELPALARHSKEATLTILQQRLESAARRERTLQEIDSDLSRIEAQVDLALENASIPGREQSISYNIAFAHSMLEESQYGETGLSVAALEDTYQELQRVKARQERPE